MEVLTGPWICPTCRATVSSAFCPTCGERPLSPRDLTFRGLLEQLLQALGSIDGRLIRSLRFVTTRPGALTLAYVEGRRKPFLGPIQLFLLANVLFAALQTLTRTNIVSSTLVSHMNLQDWSPMARRLVAQRLETKGIALDAYAPIFDQAVAVNAKALVVLMVLPFALLASVLFRRSRRPFVAHAVFSLHFYAFLLLLFCALLVFVGVDVQLGGEGLSSSWMDLVGSVINLAACGIYLYVATAVVYEVRGAARVFNTVALTLAAAAILLGYRFFLLLVTLYTT